MRGVTGRRYKEGKYHKSYHKKIMWDVIITDKTKIKPILRDYKKKFDKVK